MVLIFVRGVFISIQKVAHYFLITPINQNNKIPPFHATTINLLNKQFLPIPRHNDDNHITPPITKNKPPIIKIATRPNHTITVFNQR